ncbi:hypothetical protein Tco_0958338 [Tanacetum coccineum]
MVFYQMDTEEVSDRFVALCFVNGLEAYDGEINLGVEENMISNEYAVKLCLEHEVKRGNKVVKKELIVALRAITDFRAGTITIYPDIDPFLEETEEEEKSNDYWDHLLDFNIDDIPLLGEEGLLSFVCKMRKKEEAVKRIKGEALKEKDDPGAFIFPIRLEGQVNKNALADTGSDINTMPYRIYEQLGREDIKRLIEESCDKSHSDILIDRDAPIVVGRGFLRTIGGIVNTLERLFSTFDGFCHQTFLAARSDVMRNAESDSDDEEEYQIKRNKFGAQIYGPKPAPYLNCNDPAKLWEHTMMRPDHHDPNALDNMKPWKKYCFHKLTMSSCYGKDVTEMQSLELCHKVYSTYEFDEVCADDELQTKKIIKFRLGVRAHSLNLLEFARRLGLYQAVELEEEEENLGLSRSHTSTIKNPILRVIHKMITYGLCQRTTGYDEVQKNNLWLLSMFDARHQNGYSNVAWLIARFFATMTKDVVRSLSAPIFLRDLDTDNFANLIRILEGDLEIRPNGWRIERICVRQSYHWVSSLSALPPPYPLSICVSVSLSASSSGARERGYECVSDRRDIQEDKRSSPPVRWRTLLEVARKKKNSVIVRVLM